MSQLTVSNTKFPENEKLPFELGWKTPQVTLGLDKLQEMMAQLEEATTLKNNTNVKYRRMEGFHGRTPAKISA